MKLLLFLLGLLSVEIAAVPQTLTARSAPSRKFQLIHEGKFDELRALQLKSRAGRLMIGTQPVTNMADYFYFVNITVGTPAQTIEVQFDTLTSDVWVIDGVVNTNTTKQVFHENKSSTFVITDHGNYSFKSAFTGWFYYYVATDTVGVANFQLPEQDLLVATQFQSPESGQLGMGIAQPGKGKTVTPLTNLVKQWDAPLFTVWYDGKKNYSHGGDGGLITLGGVDKVNCESQWNYSPLTNIDQYSWQFKINGYTIGNQKGGAGTKYQVVVATSSAWIEVPDAVLRDILFATGGRYESKYYLYIVKCNTIPNLPDLVIKANSPPNGFTLNIPATQYVVDMDLDDGWCALAFDSTDAFEYENEPSTWILGDTFIRSYCSQYDFGNKRMGFAKAKHN